jgi:16S rRNA (uracil1498-N3)-methyltransferase
LKKVLRSSVKDRIILTGTDGFDYDCEISEVKSDCLRAEIITKSACETEPTVKITAFVCVPKGDRFEYIIQKTVELGVFEIVPVISAYAIERDIQKKLPRYNKIAEAAAKQSMRGVIPRAREPIHIKDINIKNYGAFYLCNEKCRQSAKIALRETAAFIIGPEGGFTYDEIEFLEKNGARSVSLGKRILRTDTAAVVFLTILMREAGEL